MNSVARMAQVSIQTVSAVINGKPGISEPTRLRVQHAVAQLNYHPNFLASSLRAQRSFTIGVLIPSITNPFFPEIVRGAEDLAQKNGYSLFLCNSDESGSKELQYLQLLQRYRVAGLIAAIGSHEAPVLDALTSWAAHRVPIVILGKQRVADPVVNIAIDDQAGTRKGVAHLLRNGHSRIGFIEPPAGSQLREDRLAGFLQAHHDFGISVCPELIVPGGFDVSDGQRGAERLMNLESAPTAIFSANDLVAIGAINKLRNLGKKVPDDVAIVGFDNIPIAELFSPSITSVAQPLYKMGQSAMQAILDRIQDRKVPGQTIHFETELIIRSSSDARLSSHS